MVTEQSQRQQPDRLIDIRDLHVSYGRQQVLRGVDLRVEAGGIVGLLGPSGAGKTTLIRTAMGMEKATSGTATVLGISMPERNTLAEVGYMAQSDALYPDLTAAENLRFFARMKHPHARDLAEEIDHVAQIVGLSDSLKKRTALFSGGMKRRPSLAIALLGDPHLLILDEPTVGIDPALSRQIWKELRHRSDEGCGLLVTTHVMGEAELVDRVALLMDGIITADDTPAALKQRYHAGSIEDVFLTAEQEQKNRGAESPKED